MNQIDKNCQKNVALGESPWSETNDRLLIKQRNTKCVAPMNVYDSQSTMLKHHHHQHNHHQMIHLPAQQSQSLTSTSSLSGSSTSNSLNSHITTSSTATTNGSCGSGTSPLENLPKKFVSSMRTLFDIMDDRRTGFVKLVDIEARWQDDGSKGLPHGVIDCLRRVTPVSGMLSFERFCAGLKICLLRNQADECKFTAVTDKINNINLDNFNNNNNNSNENNNNDNENNNNKNKNKNNNLNINIHTNNNHHKIDNCKNHFTKNSHLQDDKKAARM